MCVFKIRELETYKPRHYKVDLMKKPVSRNIKRIVPDLFTTAYWMILYFALCKTEFEETQLLSRMLNSMI